MGERGSAEPVSPARLTRTVLGDLHHFNVKTHHHAFTSISTVQSNCYAKSRSAEPRSPVTNEAYSTKEADYRRASNLALRCPSPYFW